VKRVGVVGTVLVGMLAGSAARAEDPAAAMLDQPAPSFELNEVRTGETHALEDFRGKFVVLHFGASW
jgi:hypothetical protein